MTFRDIFKSSFLENMDSVPLLDMAVALVLSFLLGLFIFAIYKQCYAGVMYSPSFGVTLVALSLITTLLILTVVSNIVLSLGMVGALSIVRFRTAVKEPMDIALLLSFLLGLFIFAIYKQCYAGVMYSPSFGVTLVALSLITTLLILTVVSNIVLSLGMVGALSIVRFRTAVKEPMDIAFLFWAIAVGIVLAAGLLVLAVGGSLFIGVVLLAFSKRKGPETPYILLLHCQGEQAEQLARAFVASQVKRLSLKSKAVESGLVELNYEVRLKEGDASFVNELERMEGVSRVTLVSYNGDYMG